MSTFPTETEDSGSIEGAPLVEYPWPEEDIPAVDSKTRTLLSAKQHHGESVFFATELDDAEKDQDISHYHEHKMSKHMWDDLGRPMVITLTIVPGDDLNGEAEGQATQEAAQE